MTIEEELKVVDSQPSIFPLIEEDNINNNEVNLVPLENAQLFFRYKQTRKQYLVLAYLLHIILIIFLIIYFVPTLLSLSESSFPQMTLDGPFNYSSDEEYQEYDEEKVLFSQTQYNGENYISITNIQITLTAPIYFYAEYINVNEGVAQMNIDSNDYCAIFSLNPLTEEQQICTDETTINFDLDNLPDGFYGSFYLSFIPLASDPIEVNVNLEVNVTLYSDQSTNEFSSPLSLFLYSSVGIIVTLACFCTSIVLQAIASSYRKKMDLLAPFKIDV